MACKEPCSICDIRFQMVCVILYLYCEKWKRLDGQNNIYNLMQFFIMSEESLLGIHDCEIIKGL